MGLLQVYFCKFVTELWPLIDVRISFPLNIWKITRWILTRFFLCIDIDNIYMKVGINQYFLHLVSWQI